MEGLKALEHRLHKLASMLGLPQQGPLPMLRADHMGMLGMDCCLVKADNLSALTWLQKQFSGSVDFCYIDPPYNTGNNFIYDDKRCASFDGVWGDHALWMSFMLPRLVAARDLLSATGIIAVSIDDYEYVHLKIVMDAVFGGENYIATIVVNRSKNGKGSRAHVAISHEYVVVYGRSKSAKLTGLPERNADGYDKEDVHGRYKVDGLFRKKGEASRREDRPAMFYPLYYDKQGNVFADPPNDKLGVAYPIDSKGVERRWLWGIEKARRDSWQLYASPNGVIYVKNYLTEEKRIKVRSIWDDPRYLTERATNEIKEIYGEKVFETPKPVGLIEDLIDCAAGKNSLILDFFAGTGTTAHATFNLNKRDSGGRRVILVEESADISEEHLAWKRGFRKTSDITEYRLKALRSADPGYCFSTVQEAPVRRSKQGTKGRFRDAA